MFNQSPLCPCTWEL